MRFAEGDVVVIANPSTLYTSQYKGKRGAITSVMEHETFPYEVAFPGGGHLSFSEIEIDPVTSFEAEDQAHDEVNHPSHYTWLPGGIEVIDITENFNFTLGNALKYIMRAGHKHDQPLTDLRKAAWYINREIARLEDTE